MLGKDGEVAFPIDIVAGSLDTAIRCAFRILHESNAFSSWLYGFKVWHEQSERLATEPVAPLSGPPTSALLRG
jgi:hypothetical protein